ncbi:MAG: hypothetical protein OEV48_15115 [Acidobacteriota bacterium]|nr:hypothetical protein [Acidobacteriota bacterium]
MSRKNRTDECGLGTGRDFELDEGRRERRPYRRPQIVTRGKIEALVAGGSGNAREGGNPIPARWRP